MIVIDRHPQLPGQLGLKIRGTPKEFYQDLNIVRSFKGSYYDPEFKLWVISHVLGKEIYEKYGKQFDWKLAKHEIYNEPEPIVIKDFKINDLEKKYFQGKILNYQTLGASFMYYNKRVICGDDVGLGKTIEAIRAALKGIYVYKDIKQSLIFTRASLKYQWATEINKFTDCSSIIINGTKAKKDKQWEKAFEKNIQFIICNWEQLICSDFNFMKSYKWDLIIGDEAHMIANYKTSRAKAFGKLESKYMWLLTATPVNGKADRAFTLINYLNKGVLGTRHDFENNYCIKDPRFGWSIVGEKNIRDLHYEIAPYIIQRKQSEVSDELPKIIHKNYYIEPTKVQQRISDKIQEKMINTQEEINNINEKDSTAKEEHERLSGLLQGCLALQVEVGNHPILLKLSDSFFVQSFVENEKDLSKSPKLTELMSILEERAENKYKVIVFTEFAKMAHIINNEILTSKSKSFKNIKTAMLTGEMKKDCIKEATFQCNLCDNYKKCNTRRKSQWDFANDENCLIFISTSAGSQGLNLQNSKELINYDLPWDPFQWDQRQGRISRVGATHKNIVVTNLIMTGTIDEAILKTHERKRDVVDKLITPTQKEKKYFDFLLKEIKKSN